MSVVFVVLLAAALPQPPAEPVRARFLIAQDANSIAGLEAAIGIESRSAAGFVKTSWPEREIRWFFRRAHGVQENRDTLPPLPADPLAAAAPTLQPGVNMVGVDFKPREARRTAAELRHELASRSAPTPEAFAKLPADAVLTVRYVESAKLLIHVNGETGPDESTVATSKSGQAVEIRPLANPMRLPVGSDFPMRLYADGDKRGEVRVIATHAASATQRQIDVDRGAFANLTLTHAGRWLVEFTHAAPRREADAPGADWIMWTATLTFDAAVVVDAEAAR